MSRSQFHLHCRLQLSASKTGREACLLPSLVELKEEESAEH